MHTDNNNDNAGEASSMSELRCRGGGLEVGSSAMKVVKRAAGATLLVAAFSVFTGLIANTFSPTQAQDSTVQIQAAVGTGDVSITIDDTDPCGNFNTGNMTLALNTIAGAVASDCVAVAVSTTNPFGYTLTIDGPSNGMLAGDNFQNIGSVTGTMETPVVFANSATDGQWGFAVPNGQISGFDWGFDASYQVLDGTTTANTALFAAVPTTATPFSATTSQNTTPNEYHVFFGVSTGQVMPTGTYTGAVTITGVANTVAPPTVTNISPNTGPLAGGTTVTITGTEFMLDGSPIVYSVTIGGAPCEPISVTSDTTLTCVTTAGSAGGVADVVVTTSGGSETLAGGFEYTTMLFMQNITAANCPTTMTMAVDARDNSTYWVQRRGNLCWMKTNLAYAGGGNNQFGDVMTMTEGIQGVNTATGQVCHGNNATLASFGTPCFWRDDARTAANITSGWVANATTYPTVPSAATDGGANAATRQYGYMYSWCAAMGGQAAACQTAAATAADPSINICPAGWRLPTGEPTTGEFTVLNNTVNAASTTSDAGLLTNWLGQRGGNFVNGAFGNIGTWGFYWSSSVVTATISHNLQFNATNVLPATGGSKGVGFAVRCVAD